MKILIFFSKSKYPNPIRNNRILTKNSRTRPEVYKYPNGFYTSIPKYLKIQNTRSEPERVPERPPLPLIIEESLYILSIFSILEFLIDLFIPLKEKLNKQQFRIGLGLIIRDPDSIRDPLRTPSENRISGVPGSESGQ